MRECLECGFIVDEPEVRDCPKCDAVLGKQTDGSTQTIDIGHDHETVNDAVEKLRMAVNQHRKGTTQKLRVVVGGGVIREKIVTTLNQMRARGRIKSYQFEKGNSGAYMVRLK
jgi:triosephosphate isomerase|tara:strand:- start:253 stop:591 length:339 start_codon:yes stop_codon:yes gene_type:complete